MLSLQLQGNTNCVLVVYDYQSLRDSTMFSVTQFTFAYALCSFVKGVGLADTEGHTSWQFHLHLRGTDLP